MRRGWNTCLWAVMAGALAVAPALQGQLQTQAQNSAAPDQTANPTNQDNARKRALTPAETEEQQRERAIRQLDPLDKSAPDDPTDVTNRTTGAVPDSGPNPATADGNSNPQPIPDRRSNATPLPNSIAASQQASTLPGQSGPRVIGDNEDTSSAPAYTGPAVLSRSYSLNRPLIPQDLKWTESIGFNTFYDSGVVAAGTGTPGIGTGDAGNINDGNS